jgi:signal transduction histidine kinase
LKEIMNDVAHDRSNSGPPDGGLAVPRFRAAAAPAHSPALAHMLQAVQEAERQRIAVDLHDGLGPLLTLVKLELERATRLLGDATAPPSAAQAALQRAAHNVARTFEELRRTVMDLRPSMLDDLGILPTLAWLVREFEHSAADFSIDVELIVEELDIPAELRIVIFRVCQEALNNVCKHARASHAVLLMARTGQMLHLQIEDDGAGFAMASGIFHRSGGGLAGIVRRVNASGGDCAVESSPGRGTRIRICWDLDAFPAAPAAPD